MIKTSEYIDFRNTVEKIIKENGKFTLFVNPKGNIECNIVTAEGRIFSGIGGNIYEATALMKEIWEKEKTSKTR